MSPLACPGRRNSTNEACSDHNHAARRRRWLGQREHGLHQQLRHELRPELHRSGERFSCLPSLSPPPLINACSARQDCTDDGSCQYPNDPSACSGQDATPIAVRVRVELADEAFEWGIDNSMMSLHRYGPFSHWPADKGGTAMVLCVAAGGHTINYPLPSLNPEQGAGRLSVMGVESAACPSGEESCALFGPADFDPQRQPLTVSFHVGVVPPPPPISDSAMCSLDYVNLFLSVAPGEKCDPGHDQDFHCT